MIYLPNILAGCFGSLPSADNIFCTKLPRCALYTRLCCPFWPPGRQVGLCTSVCTSLPGLLGAILPCTVGTGCTVRADLASKMSFGAPKWPSELQLGPPSRTPSSTWRFLGRFLVLLLPSESSSRLDESSILMVQAFLQSKRSWTAISHLFGLNLDLLDAAWAQLGAS